MPSSRWVCLMYHDISTQPGATGASTYFAVPRSAFVRQLQLIKDLGLRGCSIAEAMHGNGPRIAISFDDGDIGQVEHAFPALVDAGMTATFFITTSWVGRPRYASWEQLRAMRAAGMSIQSHTHSHPFLSELQEPVVREELRRSRELLHDRLGAGEPVTMIALPGGDAPRRELRSMIVEEGYDVVATSRWGVNRDVGRERPARIFRCTVRSAPDDAAFAAIVLGNPWLAARKVMRERVLAFVRATLGPTLYARWRRGALDIHLGD